MDNERSSITRLKIGIVVGIAVFVVGLIAGFWGIKLRRQT